MVIVICWYLYGDFCDMFIGCIGEWLFDCLCGGDLVLFVLGKFVFFVLVFGLLLVFYLLGMVVVFYVVVLVVVGFLLVIVFQLVYVVEEVDFLQFDFVSCQMEMFWVIYQLQIIVDFVCDNCVFSWLIGGFNFQVEYYLFVCISYVYYLVVVKVVEVICCEFGVLYYVYCMFFVGIVLYYCWLCWLGVVLVEVLVFNIELLFVY